MDKLGQFCIERSLKIQMLKWFGYVVRIGQDRKIREIMKTIQEGRVTIGRPRKMYMVRGDSMKKWNGYN